MLDARSLKFDCDRPIMEVYMKVLGFRKNCKAFIVRCDRQVMTVYKKGEQQWRSNS